jgi:hypothetical protein
VLAAVLASWLARVLTAKKVIKEDDSLNSVVGPLMGFLAFMLAFTFSDTASKFANRKRLVVEQAKTIGTCYLRTSLIPEKQKIETRKLLQEYVNLLLQASSTPDINKVVNRLETIHILLWHQTVSLQAEQMDGGARALFTNSVNAMIDIFSERKTVALVYRIPNAMWSCLLSLYLLCMSVIGYQIRTDVLRRLLNALLIAAAFALIVALIAEMDSSMRVSQQPMIDIQKLIQQLID